MAQKELSVGMVIRRIKCGHRAGMHRRVLEAACSKAWKLRITERPFQLLDLLFENPECLSTKFAINNHYGLVRPLHVVTMQWR